jgi:hypothetical protein
MLWLVLLHVAITSVFVVREEVAGWDSWKYFPESWDYIQPEPIPRWMTVLNAWVKGTRAPSPPAPDDWAMSVDYWPSAARKGYYMVEFPVALLVGWYQHPMSAQAIPPLSPGLLPGTHRLRVHTRILVFEALMIAIVALHWWVVARVLKRKERFARWVRIPVIAITVGGIVCALACLPPRGWRAADVVALTALMVVMIGWAWIFGASVVYAVWSMCRGAYNSVHE